MKNLTFALLCITIISCGKTSARLEHTSPNGKVHIALIGTRSNSMDAWQVEMKVKAYDFKEDQLAFEINASDINAENVSFKWVDDRNCNISMKQYDNSERLFNVLATPTELEVQHVMDKP